jgi:hypothetical protein
MVISNFSLRKGAGVVVDKKLEPDIPFLKNVDQVSPYI